MTNAVALSCQWTSRMAQLFGLWLVLSLRGGLLLGMFPAYAALHGVVRGWLAGRPMRPWEAALAEYRTEFARANRVGYAVAIPATIAIATATLLLVRTDDLSLAARPLLFAVGATQFAALPLALSLVGNVACSAGETLRSTARFGLHCPLPTLLLAVSGVALLLICLFNLALGLLLGFGAYVTLSEMLVHRALERARDAAPLPAMEN